MVDAFDAMTSNRPYRLAMPFADAVREIRSQAGRQFDPAVVEAFLRVPAEAWQEAARRAAATEEQPVESLPAAISS